jgi:hypothetical protein
MELKEFVSSGLLEIINGVKEARDKGGKTAEGIASKDRFKIDKLPPSLFQDNSGAVFTVIEFDVAVTASSKTEGSAGIKVVGINLGGSADLANSTTSRIKFAVPLKFS